MTGKRQDVWFTSDSHFDHLLMAQDIRGFESKKDHDEALVQYWNETVRPNDIVWHLGDVGMGSIARWGGYIHQLHGEINLVLGNHDDAWAGSRDGHRKRWQWLDYGFASIQEFARRKVNGSTVLLSHFPYGGYQGYSDHTGDERFAQFRLPDLGAWLLHGHTHQKTHGIGKMIHVGMDAHDLRPVSLDWVAAHIARMDLVEREDD
jgi:calcineurin-like phosphoesterase family protein